MADKTFSHDMQDSPRDKERLKKEEATINLPDVEDIPGQENIHAPRLREMADTTISSDDEEGVGIWNNEKLNEDPFNEGPVPAQQINEPASDVTPDEIEQLERSAENMDTPDNENLFRAELDNTDFEGERLNENIDVSGADLDVPGAELDDADEELGEEDEENNAYSLGDNE